MYKIRNFMKSKSVNYEMNKNVLNALYENVIISRSNDLYENMNIYWKSKWLKYRRYKNEHFAIVVYENKHFANFVWLLSRMKINILQIWKIKSKCRIEKRMNISRKSNENENRNVWSMKKRFETICCLQKVQNWTN